MAYRLLKNLGILSEPTIENGTQAWLLFSKDHGGSSSYENFTEYSTDSVEVIGFNPLTNKYTVRFNEGSKNRESGTVMSLKKSRIALANPIDSAFI